MATTEELIIYSNSRNGLGIRILGAKRATTKTGIYIKQILEDGLAQKDGRLKVGDQILSINDQTAIGISREQAVNILRSAAATNQVRLRVRHYVPFGSSKEYQKLLHDEKSTDEEDEYPSKKYDNSTKNDTYYAHRTTASEFRGKTSTQTSEYSIFQTQQKTNVDHGLQEYADDQKFKRDTSDILESLLRSKFKVSDLVNLVKNACPTLLNDPKKELKLLEYLSETNPDGRITLKDFERQAPRVLGERITLLSMFYPVNTESPSSHNDHTILELRNEVAACHSTIQELQNKIITCEKSQRLANEIELEYEDILKFLYDQLNKLKIDETNQLKHLKANDQLIQKLFHHLSTHVHEPNEEQLLAQLKYEYEQQKKVTFAGHEQKSSKMRFLSTNKS